MTSMEANQHIARGLKEADPDVETDLFAISDGGEGMTDAFARAFGAPLQRMHTVDLYGRPIRIHWAIDEASSTACVDAASMLGVTLYPHGERYPLQASSYGLGEAIRQILSQKKIRRLIIGLGGTGVNDGGMGLAAAFGAVFYDRSRHVLEPCAASLTRIAFIDKRSFRFPASIELVAACDVSNHLLGSRGATHIFGRQKGLRPGQIAYVEKGMSQLRDKIQQTFHVDMNSQAGSGAAGGLGGMLISVFGARMTSGIDLLMESPLARDAFEKADFIITGEGQSDAQSASGKVVCRIGRMAADYGKPCICIAGALGEGYEKLYDCGVCAIFSTADRAMSFVYALRHGPQKLTQEAYNVMRLIAAAKHMHE